MMKVIVRKSIQKLGFDIVRHRQADPSKRPSGFPHDFSDEERALCEFVAPYSQMSSAGTVKVLASAVEYVHRHAIEGAIVECGVWKGGQMMAVARTLRRLGALDRELYLFDTFEGMSEPTDLDEDYAGIPASEYAKLFPTPNNAVPLEQVRLNMGLTGYPAGKIRYVKGKVEDTLPAQAPERIALLRLDTDWYESTAHELLHLFPRVVPYGIVIIDDYGHFKGARQAVDEFLARTDVPLFLGRIDDTGRVLVKPPSRAGR